MLIYFEDEYNRPVAIVAKHITAIKANRLPTETPVTIYTYIGTEHRVKGSFDTAQQKYLAAMGENV